MAGSHFSLGRGWRERRQSQWTWGRKSRNNPPGEPEAIVEVSLPPVPFAECPYLFFDRLALGEWANGRWLTAVIAVDQDGYRHLLHAYLADSEDAERVHELAVARAGLTSVGLIIGQQTPTAIPQIRSTYGQAPFQLCTEAFMQAVLHDAPREQASTLRSLLKMCHLPESRAQADREVAKAAQAFRELGHDDLAERVVELGALSLAFHDFPAPHHRFVRTASVIDRQLRTLLRKPDSEQAQRLKRDPFAFLQEHVAPNWSRRRYFGMTPLKWLQTKDSAETSLEADRTINFEPVHDVLDPTELIRIEPPLETFAAAIEDDPDDHLDWLSLHEMTEEELALEDERTSFDPTSRKSLPQIVIEPQNGLPIGQHFADSSENELHIDFSNTRRGPTNSPPAGNDFADGALGADLRKTKVDPDNAGFDSMYEGDDAPGRWSFLPDRQIYVRSPGYNRYFIFSRGAQLLSLLGIMFLVGWSSFATLGWLDGAANTETAQRAAQFERELIAVQNEHATSQEQLALAETDMASMRQSLANYDPDEISRVTSERDSFAERVVSLETEIQAATALAQQSTTELQQAQDEIAKLTSEQADVQIAQEQAAEMKGRIAQLEADAEGATARVANLEAANRAYQEESGEQRETIRQLNMQIEEATGEIERLQAERATDQQLTATSIERETAAQARADEILATLTSERQLLEELRDASSALTAERDALVTENAALTTSLETQVGAMTALETQMADLTLGHASAIAEKDASLAIADKQLASLQSDFQDLQDSRADNQSEAIASLEATLTRLRDERQSLISAQGAAEQEQTRLRAELSRATSALADSGTQMAETTAELDVLKSQLTRDEAQRTALVADLQAQEQKIAQLEQEAASATSRIEANRQALLAENAQLDQQVTALTDQIAATQSEAGAERQAIVSEKEAEIVQLQGRIGELERSLNEATESRRALNENVTVTLSELETMKGQLQDTVREKETLATQIARLKEEQANVVAASLEPVQSEAESLRARVASLEQELEQASAAALNVVDDDGVINAATQRIAELEEQLKLAQALAADAQVPGAETELASLRLQVSERDEILFGLRSQMTALEDQRRMLAQELLLLRQDSSLEEVTRQRSDNERLRGQLEQALGEQAVLNTALDDSKSVINRLLTELDLQLTPPSPRKPQG